MALWKRIVPSLILLGLTGEAGLAQAEALGVQAGRFERFSVCRGFLEGASFDADGNLWVVDLLGGGIYSIDAKGKCTRRGDSGGAPNGARFHPDGRLFVADNRLGIIAIDTRTMKKEVLADTFEGKPITTANDLAFDASGGVYFTDPNGSTALNRTGRLFYLPAGKGAKPQLVVDGLAFPNGVVVSRDGNEVYVGQFADKSILSVPAVDSKAPFKTSYILVRTSGGVGPDGMAIDQAGHLLWAQFGGASIGRADGDHVVMTPLPLGKAAGPYVTNVAVRAGWLYVTEASRGEVWRVRLD